MASNVDVYRDLQRHLDRLPAGFPPTGSGVEIRILRHLFTPEEARMAIELSMLPESVERIYKRVKKTGMSKDEVEKMLDDMFHKGLVLRQIKGEAKKYSNALLAIGMYEFQVDRLTEDFAKDMEQYFDEAFGEELTRTRIPQLRTIPVEKSIPVERTVASYDDVRQIVAENEGQFAVANCICRQEKDLLGQSCSQTDLRETCLLLRHAAELYLEMGIGRPISKEEAFHILDKAQEAGLVLQPMNTQNPDNI